MVAGVVLEMEEDSLHKRQEGGLKRFLQKFWDFKQNCK